MKKTVSILMTLIIVFSFSACSEKKNENAPVSAAEIWADIVDTLPEESLPVLMDLTDSELDDYYGIKSGWVEDFCSYVSLMNVSSSEVLIIRAKSGKTDEIEQAITERQAALDAKWRDYLPEQYALVQNYRFEKNGEWLIFAVAKDAGTIVEIFKSHTS